MALLDRNSWSRLVVVGKPFFVSSARWRAGGAIAVIVTLLLALNALNVANSYVGRNFMTALSQRNGALFRRYAGLYLLVFGLSTGVAVMAQFVQDRLALSWRDWLTRHLLGRYLARRTYDLIRARKEIDNPDQRIAEDVRTFTSALLSFMVMLTNAALTTVAFAGVLWSISRLLLFAAVLYSAVGSLVTIVLGYRLVTLDQMQLRKEADLRCGIIHVREHLEPRSARVDANDARMVLRRLRRVVHNGRSVISVSRNLGFFTSGYNYMVPLLPILLVGPRYLRGDVEFGVVTQSAMAFAQLLGAFSLVVVQFQSIAAFAAVVHRIGSLWEAMEARA
jgi:vitamin B12/bleomycin/antimicrobial peptide transport system ATP-binding/permease protein